MASPFYGKQFDHGTYGAVGMGHEGHEYEAGRGRKGNQQFPQPRVQFPWVLYGALAIASCLLIQRNHYFF